MEKTPFISRPALSPGRKHPFQGQKGKDASANVLLGSVLNHQIQDRHIRIAHSIPAHYRYSGVQTGELVCVPLREKGVEAELQLLYPVLAFQQHPSFRSLVNNLESEMQRFVQVHLPA